jgi:aldehyde:ferredoxin oxidoreductase
MKVFEGKILRVDLSPFGVFHEPFDAYRPFIGGRGVNQHILLSELPLNLSLFDPSNLLVIGAGALAGTDAPAACRLSVDSRNALTDGIGSSNCGGYFASEMRFAGVNHIVINGTCRDLSYLYIKDGETRLLDARDLRGKSTTETERILRERHGDAKVLCIGPAGENRVRSSCLMADGARAVARCGLGAVMGSKNLKALVVKGTGTVEVEHPDRFRRIVDSLLKKLSASAFNQKRMKYGVFCYEPWDVESPYRNFSGRVPPPENKRRLSPDEFLKFKKGEKGCFACPIRCWAIHEFQEGDRVIHSEALQGNDPHNFGAKLDLSDPRDVLKAHTLCNDLGLDVDNASGVIAWAMECYERGLLTKRETGGLDLRWGDTEVVFRLLEDIAYRRGLGDLLAEGCRLASKRIGRGTEAYCLDVKGQELFECLWRSPSWALGTLVSPRGGTHTRGAAIEGRFQDIDRATCERYFGIPRIGDLSDYDDKERLVFFFERLEAFLDCVGICMFTHSLRLDMLLPEDYAELFSAATGHEIDVQGILHLGERTHNIEKAFNVLHTRWDRRDDMPPDRFVTVPLDGKYRIDLERWNALLDRYYALHGWDHRGLPTRKSLTGLGLREVADRLGGRISER